jgi:hypothetical protein
MLSKEVCVGKEFSVISVSVVVRNSEMATAFTDTYVRTYQSTDTAIHAVKGGFDRISRL